MKLLENKNVIITGATRGIGKEIALLFAQHGANIAFSYLSSDEQAKKLEEHLSSNSNTIKAYKSDASDFASAYELYKNVLKEFTSIDVLVNNAGITKDGLLIRMSEEDFTKVMDVNMKSVFNMTKVVLPSMLKQRQGSIINMSSIVGLKGNVGQANYSASKAGIIAMSKSLALEYAKKNITINCISPGFIKTEMTDKIEEKFKNQLIEKIPINRLGEPNDVANIVCFLSSDLSNYITGETIHVNGGMYFG